ncbi:hypothetical protein UFOVP965_135 [uncultured Caudovirales phage]|uniref:Holin n=1 Tax=uncultured Caudovirales phage TaxID=2100421 RepID=A0A6J5PYP2_9CAUD|nr:hypothetical protein UFOVP965_135 [uncultured Caudovirales phage]CAB4179924.1 hypothetical protein UFOVP1035_131 [uncultured Caudovirales phage]CAB4188770.1 hypothetical protein UFOVP1181_90 [uncultured Caudovirales phage]
MNTAFKKSVIRNLSVLVGVVITATQTYAAAGNVVGFNKETYIGVAISLLFPLGAVVTRYLDKADPAFGKVSDAAVSAFAELLSKKLLKPASKDKSKVIKDK